MVHSNKTIYALLLAVIILCGCSQREEEDKGGLVGDSQSEMAYVQFVLQANGPSISITRSPSDGTVEDSYIPEQGTAEEYKVNSARVYLFDNASKLFVKSVQLTGLTRTGTTSSGNIIYEAERVSVPQGTYDIFVLANTERKLNTENEDKFLADIDNSSYTKGAIYDISAGIEMTNRATDNLGVVIVNNKDYKDNVVTIVIERVLARLDVAKSAESYPLTDETMSQYATISLKGYYVVNLPKWFYTFRHTAVLTDLTEPQWKLPDNFGKVADVNGYVIDPYFFNKTISAVGFDNPDKYYEQFFGGLKNIDPKGVTWTSFNPVGSEPQYKTMYCLENCTLAPASKNGYSTGIIFKAEFTPSKVYQLSASGQLVLITDKTKYPDVLYYFNYSFYNSLDALAKAVGASSASEINLDQINARKYVKSDEGYMCYYNYWIRHYDNNRPTEMGVMEFAIVRNNLYRMKIVNITDLGPGEPVIDTDIPDEGNTFLKVVLNVKPWIVRDQTDIKL